MIQHIKTCTQLQGARVILRASLNEPIEKGVLRETSRIDKALTTIKFLQDHGARTMIIGHLSNSAESMHPVYEYLSKHISLRFVPDMFSATGLGICEAMQNGEIILTENIRQYPGEESNDRLFAEAIASCADIFVNDDFTVAHRNHATVVTLPTLIPSYAGFQFSEEYERLSEAFTPQIPSLLILGGAKPEVKIPLAKQFLSQMTTVFVGGISANILLKAQGHEVGTSVVSEIPIPVDTVLSDKKLLLPVDARVQASGGETVCKEITDIQPNDMILDAGPKTLAVLEPLIREAKFIIWNGPLGDYEKGFYESTNAVAELLAKSSARIVIGGGDTVASLKDHVPSAPNIFVSTAGGAMLDFLADGTLLGIGALEKGQHK